MKDYPIITKKELKKCKALKKVQRKYCKMHRHTKGKFPKAKIGKVIELREKDNFIDLTINIGIKENLGGINSINMSADEFLNEIRKQKVCGFSGSGFPTDIKLQTIIKANTKEKYLIVNGVECDPGLIHDTWLIQHHLSEIEKGIQILDKYVGFTKIILATKEDNIQTSNSYQVHTVPNRYPMGAEKILINEILEIELSANEIPVDKGFLVINVQTVYAIYEAILNKCEANTRFVTLADLTSGDAIVARVSMRDNIINIINTIMGKKQDKTVYFGGGIMSGVKAGTDDIVSAKTNFIGYGNEKIYTQDAKCKKCGMCARKCPMNIKVNKIIQAIEKDNLEKVKELQPEKCIQCGTCTYYCSAGKNTMDLVSSFKN